MDTQQTTISNNTNDNKLPTAANSTSITSAFWIFNALILAWNLLFNILDSLANILISIQKGNISNEEELHLNNMKNFVSNTFNSTSTPFNTSTLFSSHEDIIKEVATNVMEVSNTSGDCCPSSSRSLNNEFPLQVDPTTSTPSVIATSSPQLPEESTASAEEPVDNRPPTNWSEASFDADEESSSESEDDEDELHHSSTAYSTSDPLSIPTMNSTASDSDSRSSTPPTTDDPQVVPSEKAKSKRRRRRGKRKSKAQKEAARLELEQAATASTDPSSTSTVTPNSKQVRTPSKQNTPSKNNPQKKNNTSPSSNQKNNNKSKNQKNNLQTSVNASNLIGKSDTVAPPRRFSHSALRLKSDLDEANNSNLDSSTQLNIKPIRQPFGPMIGNNFGFSSEYQKSRRLAIQRSKAN